MVHIRRSISYKSSISNEIICLKQVKVQFKYIDCIAHLGESLLVTISRVHISSSLLYFPFLTVLYLQGRRLSGRSQGTSPPPLEVFPNLAVAHAGSRDRVRFTLPPFGVPSSLVVTCTRSRRNTAALRFAPCLRARSRGRERCCRLEVEDEGAPLPARSCPMP